MGIRTPHLTGPTSLFHVTATRRRVGGESGARRLSDQLQIPVYDVQKVGYPQRMRDHDARRRIERQRALREELEG